jgi:hypothetical protein
MSQSVKPGFTVALEQHADRDEGRDRHAFGDRHDHEHSRRAARHERQGRGGGKRYMAHGLPIR